MKINGETEEERDGKTNGRKERKKGKNGMMDEENMVEGGKHVVRKNSDRKM